MMCGHCGSQGAVVLPGQPKIQTYLLVYKFRNISSKLLSGSIGVYFPEVLK
jgi:hypothetical protein